jgi:hypothetical protein
MEPNEGDIIIVTGGGEVIKIIHVKETPDETECVCGHSLEMHSQLSTGCYALPKMGCDCSGYLSKNAGFDEEKA